MEHIVSWIVKHAQHAHWFSFILILLAGLNIPVSIDLVVIVSAILAATVVPQNTFLLVGSIFFGACFSAMISYWFGRKLGEKLQNKKWFSTILNPSKIQKMHSFYDKHGFWTLLVGRFIPFGVRNCLFMSSGVSRVHFGKFILRDAVACLIWCCLSFYLFYSIGQNYAVIYKHFMWIWLGLIVLASLVISLVIWRKKANRRNTEL